MEEGPRSVEEWYAKHKYDNLFFCIPHRCLLTLQRCIERQQDHKVTEKIRLDEDAPEFVSAKFKPCEGCINWQYKKTLPPLVNQFNLTKITSLKRRVIPRKVSNG